MICLENTHNAAGGAVLRPDQLAAIAAVAREYAIPVHLDGARLFNAQVALGVPLRDLTADADTVALSLSKGLSAPTARCCAARRRSSTKVGNVKRIGVHSLTNAGIHAAAGLVALNTMVARLAEDHRRARTLAQQLAELPGVRTQPEHVQTNIVMAAVDGALRFVERLAQRGVLALTYSDTVVRFVTHRHITDANIERAVAAVRDLVPR